MGNILTHWWWRGDPDQPNPVSGLSLRDINNVQKTWASVYTNHEANGIELFKRFFRADSNTKTLFNSFKHVPEDQLSSNVLFRSHAINLMSNLNMAILNLNKPEVVTVIMHKLGTSHKAHNVPRQYFHVLKDVIVSYLVNDLKLSDAQMASWNRFFDFIYPHIFAKLNGTKQ